MPKKGSSVLYILTFYIRFERFDLFQDKFRADNKKPCKKNDSAIKRVEKRLLNTAAENAR